MRGVGRNINPIMDQIMADAPAGGASTSVFLEKLSQSMSKSKISFSSVKLDSLKARVAEQKSRD